MNDRGGIYALGYPVITAFGHLINLAELVFLAFVLFVLLIAGATHLQHLRFADAGERTGAACAKSGRASTASCVWHLSPDRSCPVIILALATRAYFANELTAGIEEAAARTATVAQRLVEDYAALQQRGTRRARALDDDIMVLVSRAIDEDVNLFDGARLQATSALDLYASQLLSTRTPADVYRRLVLERAPTYVGEQEVGSIRYADRRGAGPHRGTRRDRHRARDAEASGDRSGKSTSWIGGCCLRRVLFSLLGAGLGYVDGRAHCRSRQPPHARNAAHRARRSGCAHRRHLGRRARAPGSGLQSDGRGPAAPAQRAGTHAAARGLGRHGAAGRARHQEPADADSAVGRARPAREHRSRPAALAGARRMRDGHSQPGEAAAPDRRRSSRASPRLPRRTRSRRRCRRSWTKSSRRTAPDWPAGSRSTSMPRTTFRS